MSNSTGNRRSPLALFPGQSTPRLYDCVVEALRTRHYGRRTEEAYLRWTRRVLACHNGTRPREMAEMDVNRFLTHPAVGANVAASTQNQALVTVLFLTTMAYTHVLNPGGRGLQRPLDRPRKAGSSENGQIMRSDQSASNWEKGYWTWKKSLQWERLWLRFADGGFVFGLTGTTFIAVSLNES